MFQSVTSIESEDEARSRMEAARWDLQAAVETFLTGGAPDEGSDRARRPPSPPREMEIAARSESRQIQPRDRTQRRGFRGIFRVIFFPIWLVFSIASFIGEKISNIVRGGPPAIEHDPRGTETGRFAARFDRMYSSAHPTFFDGSLTDALAAAEASFQFLLVFLHSEMHPFSADFCRRVLNRSEIIRFIDDHFVFWARRVTTSEGHSAQNALGASTFPFLAVVRSLRGRPHGQTLSVLEGRRSSDEVMAWLQNALERYGATLTRARMDREQREQNRLLREQQDREYHETLEADRRREERAREEERKKQEEEKRLQEEQEAEQRRLEELASNREKKKEALAEQPDKGPGVTSIVLRLPDGTRVDRRFHVSDTLGKVFDWADVQGVSIEHAALVTSYPRKSYVYPEDADRSIEEAGMSQGTMLLIEERSE